MSAGERTYPKSNRRIRRRLAIAVGQYQAAAFQGSEHVTRGLAQAVVDAADALLLDSRGYRYGRLCDQEEGREYEEPPAGAEGSG